MSARVYPARNGGANRVQINYNHSIAATLEIAMRLVIFAVSLCLAYPVAAEQNKPIPPEVIDKLARDLSRMQPADPNTLEGAFAAAATRARGSKTGLLTITAKEAKVFGQASTAGAIVKSAQRGDAYPFLEERGDWYKVQLTESSAGWVRSADVLPTKMVYEEVSQRDPNWFQRKVTKLLRDAAELKNAYRDNPYITVKGFSISLGMTPSLNIDFEFK